MSGMDQSISFLRLINFLHSFLVIEPLSQPGAAEQSLTDTGVVSMGGGESGRVCPMCEALFESNVSQVGPNHKMNPCVQNVIKVLSALDRVTFVAHFYLARLPLRLSPCSEYLQPYQNEA